ncbi:hypothetical protein ACQPZP_31380 [Spirillospora sp. CA-142024]|uniref:hypothetical protein n=1 Tax=Spirillospora sp. CA-142024 TaxID=3240036 RepID=UPI003D8D1CE0
MGEKPLDGESSTDRLEVEISVKVPGIDVNFKTEPERIESFKEERQKEHGPALRNGIRQTLELLGMGHRYKDAVFPLEGYLPVLMESEDSITMTCRARKNGTHIAAVGVPNENSGQHGDPGSPSQDGTASLTVSIEWEPSPGGAGKVAWTLTL